MPSMSSDPIWRSGASLSSPWIWAGQDFIVSETVLDAWVQCACSTPFALYLNGRLVGRGLGPTLTADPVWERFEIAPFLRLGDNLLLVLAGGLNGGDRAWFKAAGELRYPDGQRALLGTGPLWRVRRADEWQAHDGAPLSRVYFAAQSLENCTVEGFRTASWETPAVVEQTPAPLTWAPRPALETEAWAHTLIAFGELDSSVPLPFTDRAGPLATCKCVHREALLQPGKQQSLVQTREPSRAVYLTLDFGRLRTGFPRLRLRGAAGGIVDLGFAQSPDRIESGLRYVSREGRQEWTSFQLETCRYMVVRLSNWPLAAQFDCISLVERRTQVASRNAFHSTADLSPLWDTGQRTLDACRQETYYLSWKSGRYDWVNAYLFALNDFYLTGDCRTAAAMLAGNRAPRPAVAGIEQSLAYVLFADAYHWHSGDPAPVQPRLQDILQLLEDCGNQRNGQDTYLAALYAAALEAAARLCRALGERESAKICRQQYRQACQAVQTAWRPQPGLFADRAGEDDHSFSLRTNALILYFSLSHQDQTPRLLEQLGTLKPLSPNPFQDAFLLAGGLWRAGAGAAALDVVARQWNSRLANKGHTWGEKTLSQAPEPAPGAEFFLGAEILGVQPKAPGYRILEIRPQPSGLQRAAGRLCTSRGVVSVEWQLGAQQHFTLRAELSEEGETRLAVPRLGRRFPTLTLNGETVWRNEKVYPNAYVRQVISERERIVLVLHQQGRYEVTAS